MVCFWRTHLPFLSLHLEEFLVHQHSNKKHFCSSCSSLPSLPDSRGTALKKCTLCSHLSPSLHLVHCKNRNKAECQAVSCSVSQAFWESQISTAAVMFAATARGKLSPRLFLPLNPMSRGRGVCVVAELGNKKKLGQFCLQ